MQSVTLSKGMEKNLKRFIKWKKEYFHPRSQWHGQYVVNNRYESPASSHPMSVQVSCSPLQKTHTAWDWRRKSGISELAGKGEVGGNNNVSHSYKFYFLTISLAPLSNGFRTETLRKVNLIYAWIGDQVEY